MNKASQLFSSLDLSAETLQSAGIYTNDFRHFAITLMCSGSPVGEFKLQGSNSQGTKSSSEVEADSWVDIPAMNQNIDQAATIQWNIGQSTFRYVRIVWTKTSGSGTIDKVEIEYL